MLQWQEGFDIWGTFLQDHRLEMNNYAKERKNNKNNVAFWFIGSAC